MEKLTKSLEKIETKIKNISSKHNSFKLDPSKGLGGVNQWSATAKQANPITNGYLSKSEQRELMTKEEYDNPAYGHLTYDRVCKHCNAKLSYEERMGQICKACADKQKEERKKAENKAALERLAATNREPTIIEKILTKEPNMVETTPVKSVVTFLKPEEQENSVCRVSTIKDLLMHAPDRSLVFVNIENYNVYQTIEKKD